MFRHPVYSVVHPAGCLIPCIEAMYGVYRAMKLPIYLDYSATTPVDPRVAEKMMQFLTWTGPLVTRPRVHTVLAGRLKRR